jgi:hypothetical protein
MTATSRTSPPARFSLTGLVPEAQQRLIELGAPLLLTDMEARSALAERKIRAFERKYKTTLVKLQREGLAEDANMDIHEDFVEWSGWERTREEAGQIVASLRQFQKKSLAFAAAS